MKIFDTSFSHHKINYFLQPFLASLCLFLVILLGENLGNNIIIASVGATAFIIFVVPNYKLGTARLILGGYIVSILVGFIFFHIFTLSDVFWKEHLLLKAFFSSFAVGVAIFIMVVIDCEHPPAAGVALDVVIRHHNYISFLYLLFTVAFMLLIKHLLRKYLINLI
jgi:CBS-domain-containing membrane protein